MSINNFEKEITSVWSFPKRGSWATHNPEYRGNFAPQIPKNIILKYSKECDYILDPMVGSGTTLIEAKLHNRNGIGYDINPKAVELTKKNLEFSSDSICKQEISVGNIKDMSCLSSNSIDLIITHPPYLNIIKYSNGEMKEDLSNISNIKLFLQELSKGIKELYRVLKENHFCAILIGDTRKHGHFIPLSYYVMRNFLRHGFILKEDIIKIQHNCLSTPYWKNKVDKYNFYLIMHEHLYVFRKPNSDEKLTKFKYSAFCDDI